MLNVKPFVPDRPTPSLLAPMPEPPESPIAATIRGELKRMLDEPLTVQRALKLARTVGASIKLLQATTEGVEGLLPNVKRRGGGMMMGGGVMDDFGLPDYGDGAMPMAWAPPGETFGNQALREFVKGVQALIEAKNQPKPLRPEELIEAIVSAKNADLPEIAEEFKTKLRALLAEKPKETPPDAERQQSLFVPPGVPVAVVAAQTPDGPAYVPVSSIPVQPVDSFVPF